MRLPVHRFHVALAPRMGVQGPRTRSSVGVDQAELGLAVAPRRGINLTGLSLLA